jgi:hypothetical protein
MDQFYTPFFSNIMRQNRYLHILQFLYFTDNRTGAERTEGNYASVWKIRDRFEILKRTFLKFYNPSENLALDKVMGLFKERVIFRQYSPKKHKHFGIKFTNFATQLVTHTT